jgi:hypothetical protein
MPLKKNEELRRKRNSRENHPPKIERRSGYAPLQSARSMFSQQAGMLC